LSRKLSQPGYTYKKIVKNQFKSHGVQGIFGMMHGFVTSSDKNGQLIFPRKSTSQTINLLVSEKVNPIFMIAPSTIHHWEIEKNSEAALYQIQYSKDEKTGAYLFNSSKSSIPDDRKIELNTIILLINPKYVYVPEGASMAAYSPNLVLPDIFIKKNNTVLNNALYTTKIKQYFEQINKSFKLNTANIAMLLNN
jgi:hypothetical protein